MNHSELLEILQQYTTCLENVTCPNSAFIELPFTQRIKPTFPLLFPKYTHLTLMTTTSEVGETPEIQKKLHLHIAKKKHD